MGELTYEVVRLLQIAGDIFIHLGPKPHNDMPKYLAVADLVCLPQLDTPYARAQIPAKVFEAMAMEKAIIATSVSDLPEILSGCGLIVPPGDVDSLSKAIERLAMDVEFRETLGKAARARCIKHYSWDAMENSLNEVTNFHYI